MRRVLAGATLSAVTSRIRLSGMLRTETAAISRSIVAARAAAGGSGSGCSSGRVLSASRSANAGGIRGVVAASRDRAPARSRFLALSAPGRAALNSTSPVSSSRSTACPARRRDRRISTSVFSAVAQPPKAMRPGWWPDSAAWPAPAPRRRPAPRPELRQSPAGEPQWASTGSALPLGLCASGRSSGKCKALSLSPA